MSPTERAQRAARLLQDTDFMDFVRDTRDAQVRVFTDPAAKVDEIQSAHDIIKALSKIEAQLHSAAGARKILDKRNTTRGTAP